MSAPLVPSPLDYVGNRRFVLYPPIANAGPNDWLRGRSSWSEAQLINAVTGRELWIGWQYICGVSDGPDLEIVVEVKDGLELRGDQSVAPSVSRVITMPPNAGQVWVHHTGPRRNMRKGPATVVGIRVQDESAAPSPVSARLLLIIAALLILSGMVFRIVRL